MKAAAVDGQPARMHWFGDHPKELKNDPPFGRFIAGMGQMAADLHAAGVQVINCSRISALPYWPKMTLAEAIGQIPA